MNTTTAAIRVEQQRAYDVPCDKAFTYITDPHNWPEYWPDLVAVHDLDHARWRDPGESCGCRCGSSGGRSSLR